MLNKFWIGVFTFFGVSCTTGSQDSFTIPSLAEFVDGNSKTVNSTDKLKVFKRLHGITLPEDYESFQAISDGGELPNPLTIIFSSSLYQSGEGRIDLEHIYGAGRKDRHGVIPLSVWFKSTERAVTSVPRKIFVIGEDSWGNQITMDLRSDTFGQIALVDHETVGDDFYDRETYVVIAPTFSNFVSRLRLERGVK